MRKRNRLGNYRKEIIPIGKIFTLARRSFLSEPRDMEWLREVHLPGLSKRFKSAMLYGNEDCPETIEVYYDADPEYNDTFESYTLVDEI